MNVRTYMHTFVMYAHVIAHIHTILRQTYTVLAKYSITGGKTSVRENSQRIFTTHSHAFIYAHI